MDSPKVEVDISLERTTGETFHVTAPFSISGSPAAMRSIARQIQEKIGNAGGGHAMMTIFGDEEQMAVAEAARIRREEDWMLEAAERIRKKRLEAA